MPNCGHCKFWTPTPADIVPSMTWKDGMQEMTLITYDYEGYCEHEYNWRPSRGNMPCDADYRCSYFEEVKA